MKSIESQRTPLSDHNNTGFVTEIKDPPSEKYLRLVGGQNRLSSLPDGLIAEIQLILRRQANRSTPRVDVLRNADDAKSDLKQIAETGTARHDLVA